MARRKTCADDVILLVLAAAVVLSAPPVRGDEMGDVISSLIRDAKDDAEALALFASHFIETGLVNASFRDLVDKCRCSILASEPEGSLSAAADEVLAFIEAVRILYDDMDPSLRFRPVAKAGATRAEGARSADATVDREADFRGVACPLNYVKTKLALDQMAEGQVLSVLLDEEGAHNVPESARGAGHQVLSVTQDGDHWRVVMRKSQ